MINLFSTAPTCLQKLNSHFDIFKEIKMYIWPTSRYRSSFVICENSNFGHNLEPFGQILIVDSYNKELYVQGNALGAWKQNIIFDRSSSRKHKIQPNKYVKCVQMQWKNVSMSSIKCHKKSKSKVSATENCNLDASSISSDRLYLSNRSQCD